MGTIFDRKKFLGVLGLLGSNFAGERATAAEMATSMLSAAGLTWPDVLQMPPRVQVKPAPRYHDTARDMLHDLADVAGLLTPSRRDFVLGCLEQTAPLSAKQRQVLQDIWQRHFGRAARP